MLVGSIPITLTTYRLLKDVEASGAKVSIDKKYGGCLIKVETPIGIARLTAEYFGRSSERVNERLVARNHKVLARIYG